MARRNQSNQSSRTRGRGGNGKKNSSGILIAVVAVAALALVGAVVYFLTRSDNYTFQRSHLETYLEQTAEQPALLSSEGADVYFDMSDGMNCAFSPATATPTCQQILKSLINKLASDKNTFYRLAQLKITPLEMPFTEVYNYLLDKKNYSNQMAPIEKTLDAINTSGKPAVLITDYEEYKGERIEKGAYAKKMFTEWLAKGFDIYFYKWGFEEYGKQKYLFVTVFDDATAQLNKQVEQALSDVDPSISKFVVAGREFDYPVTPDDTPGRKVYLTPVKGGNYHGDKNIDNVSNVLEDGSSEAYARFESLRTEYYPLGVDWQNASQNAITFSDSNVPDSLRYSHFLSGLFVDFSAQDGYDIENVALHTTDMDSVMQNWALNGAADGVSTPEVKMLLDVSLEAAKRPNLKGWDEIVIDFDKNFAVPANPNALIRAQVVIAEANVNRSRIEEFFTWTDNPSLAASVKLALQVDSSSPKGRVIYTYYIKVI
ncbi:MAG: hypothetical protein K2G35_02390 [Duncaniella sp.]|nr:hypothetical protein [Duncaniella sp.]